MLMNIDPVSFALNPAPQTNRKAAGESFQDALTTASSSEKSKITDAAKQFEALMIGQILKSARQSSEGGWLGTGGDQAGEMAVDVAEQQFAQAMSAKGGLGIAQMVVKGLERNSPKAATSGSPTSTQATRTNTDSTR